MTIKEMIKINHPDFLIEYGFDMQSPGIEVEKVLITIHKKRGVFDKEEKEILKKTIPQDLEDLGKWRKYKQLQQEILKQL